MKKTLDEFLKALAFPGEDAARMETLLKSHATIDIIMSSFKQPFYSAAKPTIWGISTILNLAIIIILGVDKYFLSDYFGMSEELMILFFIFFGLIIVVSLAGFLSKINTKGLEKFIRRA